MRNLYRSRHGKAAGFLILVLLVVGGFVAFKASKIWISGAQTDQIVSAMPSSMASHSRSRLSGYFAEEFSRATGLTVEPQDVDVQKGRGTIEVTFKYRVPIDLIVFKYTHVARRNVVRAIEDGAVTTDGKKVRKQTNRHSEHTETYTLP